MTGKKPWYQSTTIQGLIILAATIVTNRFGVSIGDGEKAVLKEIVTGLGEVIGTIMVLVGRLKADTKITK